MSSQTSSLSCQNQQCSQARNSWLGRWRQPKGIWLKNRWYCSPTCFEQGAVEEFSRINLKQERIKPIRHRLPLGLLMLSKGFISTQDMQRALKAQRESQRGRFGQWLIELGIVTEEQLTIALGMQWGCPVFHLAQSPGLSECALMVPLYTMETARMAPVHYLPSGRTLYVAFSDGIDFATLRSLGKMLECRTQPVVISQSEMAAAHEEFRRMDRPSETLLDCPRDFRELARQVREWTEANQAERVGEVSCPGSLWVRIEGPATVGHLLFRYPAPSKSAAASPALQAISSRPELVYL